MMLIVRGLDPSWAKAVTPGSSFLFLVGNIRRTRNDWHAVVYMYAVMVFNCSAQARRLPWTGETIK